MPILRRSTGVGSGSGLIAAKGDVENPGRYAAARAAVRFEDVKLFSRIALGVLGGFSATGPMTTAMLALHRWLPRSSRYPLPPREIVAQLPGASGGKSEGVVTLASHFAFGSAMGGLYGAAVARPESHWAGKGCIAGLLVWVGNYLILLPLLGVLRPATKHPGERNVLMIVAHLIWGITVAGFLASTARDKSGGLLGPSNDPKRDQ